jgi:5'-methylthioadenosine nucleosidase
MNRIVVVMAMAAEAAPILDRLGAVVHDAEDATGFVWHRAERRGCEVIVACNGVDARHGVDAIGTVPAALNAFLVARTHRPELLVTAGTAGGWAHRGAEIGDVYVSAGRFVYHDRRIDLPGFSAYGVGGFPAVNATALADALGFKTGVVTTGNSLDESADDRRMIAASGASIKDMEAAAVAWVGDVLRVPVLGVKAITDLVDAHADTAAQFQANLAMASDRLCDALVRVLDWCAPRAVADLGGTS